MNAVGGNRAVLLTRAADEAVALEAVAKEPKRFVYFLGADAAREDAVTVLRNAVKHGAKGFGELKSHVASDGPEMLKIYSLAADLRVPVLIHFQEVPQFAGETGYNTGLRQMPATLKKYKKTTFIGHADFFWANISANVPMDVPYPQGRVKPGGLTDQLLVDFPNLYGDLSASSGHNAITRDREFAKDFLSRHQNKLMWGCDCNCRDGFGENQSSILPRLKNKCVARETLLALKDLTTPGVFRKIVWDNGTKLLDLSKEP